MWKEVVVVLLEVIDQYMPGRTEENHEESQPVS
jgi:hypothetical protein